MGAVKHVNHLAHSSAVSALTHTHPKCNNLAATLPFVIQALRFTPSVETHETVALNDGSLALDDRNLALDDRSLPDVFQPAVVLDPLQIAPNHVHLHRGPGTLVVVVIRVTWKNSHYMNYEPVLSRQFTRNLKAVN